MSQTGKEEVEQVLVIPTSIFHGVGHFQGFTRDVDGYLRELLNEEHLSFRPRPEMEKDPSFKQLIPYVIFHHLADGGGISLFAYTRGSGQGETRLHAKRSIGVGGHICSQDQLQGHPYLVGLQRELDEEVVVAQAGNSSIVGLINDDETEVGKVHLGIVHVTNVLQPLVTPREADMCEAGFVPVSRLLAEIEQFESWSQYCLRALFTHPAA